MDGIRASEFNTDARSFQFPDVVRDAGGAMTAASEYDCSVVMKLECS